MAKMNDQEQVAEQYSDDKNLSIRIKLHVKHSTSKIPVSDWFFSQYSIDKPCRILELGCGNASQWNGKASSLPAGTVLVLSDLSKGMVDTTWNRIRNHPNPINNIFVQNIDIQNIPYAGESFDIVIANHMLYHVPDLKKALSEVKRVLMKHGTFFAATNGSGGMRSYLHEKLKEFNPKLDAFQSEWNFTLQTGADILKEFFGEVRLAEYKDSLHITETQDLVDWICSTITFADISTDDLGGLYDFFEKIRVQEGAINIPKEMGLFVSKK